MSYRHIALLSIPFIAFPAFADTTELDSMVVTATRTALATDKLLSSVSVISREDIERYNYQTLAEALNSLPGVVIANNGGLGKVTSLFLRGTESNHTQILLNGAKLATNEFGAPQLEHIPLNQIERIELVRGPQSSLYGSESIGGTIQIFTKKGADKLTPTFSVGYGTHNTKETTIGLSGGDDNNWFNLSLGYKESDGFNACKSSECPTYNDFGEYNLTTDDDDGYRNANSSLRAGHRFTNNAEIEIFSLYSKGKTDYDGYYNKTDFRQHTFGTNLSFDVLDNWSISTSLSQGRMESDNYNNDLSFPRFSFADNKQNNFNVQNDIQLNEQHLLTIGYDYEEDKIKESAGFVKTERDNHGVFAQLLGDQGRHNYRIALRNDDNEQFGSHTTGNIAWGSKISDSLRIHASFGTAFVAPSLLDLYNPDSWGFPTSNSELEPERSRSYELGFSGNHAGVNWSANVYHTKIKDLISLDTFWVPQNISEARIVGVEIQGATQLAGLDLDSQFWWLDPEDKSGSANDGNVLARRAKHTFTLNAHKSFGQFSLTSKVFVSGRRFDDAANTKKLNGYTTVDLISAYQINTSTNVQLKVSNLFNEEYETVAGYNTNGTNFFLSLNYQP